MTGRITRYLAFCLLLLLLLLPGSVRGWETRVKGNLVRSDWMSIYEAMPVLENGKVVLHGNEHAEISAMALAAIGAGQLLDPENGPVIVDLNASYFRRDLLYHKGGSFVPGGMQRQDLELRLLPPPPMFSGIPDFSYTISDWINKNQLCPLPDNAPERKLCHGFNGWLGAALNASHFGTQATRNYQRVHKVAMNLADYARRLRNKLAQTPGALKAYHDHVREAEWMALAYEGFAQHFLADRWSTGHMWERWNAGDFEHLPIKSLKPNAVVGYLSGLIHGWQAALHGRLVAGRGGAHALWADPLSVPYPHTKYKEGFLFRAYKYWARGESPKIELVGIDPAVYLHRQGRGYLGVGDDMLKDMWDGDFGGPTYGFTNKLPLLVPGQRKQMMACIEGGWADVIRALGRNPDGGYGIQKIPLKSSAPSLEALGEHCFDMYVTNRSMMWAWPFSRPTYWSQLGRAVVTAFSSRTVQRLLARLAKGNPLTAAGAAMLQQVMGSQLALGRHSAKLMVQISQRIWERARRDPGGTDLARGGLGALDFRSRQDRARRGAFLGGGAVVEPGNHYPAASYLPSGDLTTLPEHDGKTGRDKEAVYGFFSRATAPLWTGKIAEVLEKLRAQDHQGSASAQINICTYLADFIYNGTDPAYHGRQAEQRTVDGGKDGQTVPSYLSALGISLDTEKLPVYLPPGYVNAGAPYQRTADTFASVSNWCRRVPVLLLSGKPEERDQDIVAAVEDLDEPFDLSGIDLGQKPGRLHLIDHFDLEILSWTPTQIRARLPQGRLDAEPIKPGDYELRVFRADGGVSPGRFVIRIGKQLAIAGTVREQGGAALADATVSVQLAGKQYTGVSNAKGSYRIAIPPAVPVPDSVFVKAEKSGYVTATRSVAKKQLGAVNFVLTKESKYTVQVDSGLHHLGNSQYGGAINSQFQMPNAEGVKYVKDFQLSAEQVPPHVIAAELTLTVRGAEEQNPVTLNGQQIGFLSTSNADGSASVTSLGVDGCLLLRGRNVLSITASDSNSNGDEDDFEFANIQLILKDAKSASSNDRALAKLTSVKATTPDFGRRLGMVHVTDSFAVEARGEGRCKQAADVALVWAYLRREGEDMARKLTLMETGPDTGVFRSGKALKVADFHARAGDVLVLRAGLRGAALKIVGSPLKVVWRVYSLEVKRYQRLLPDISVIETRLLRGDDGRVALERIRYPVSQTKGPAVDAVLWSVEWQSGHRLEHEQAEGEEAARRLMGRAQALRKDGFPLNALPERIAAVYGGPARPLHQEWRPAKTGQ